MLHRLQFENTASNSGFNIDESGFLTFPNKRWGLSIKQRIDHDVFQSLTLHFIWILKPMQLWLNYYRKLKI